MANKMEHFNHSLKDIENSLKEALRCIEINKKICTGVRKRSYLEPNEYDFKNFEQMDIFRKLDSKNSSAFLKSHEKITLIDVCSSFKDLLANLTDNQQAYHNAHLAKMKEMTDEIHAVRSAQAFVEYWLSQLDEYDLQDYPEGLLKCFKKIPAEKSQTIIEALSKIKPFNKQSESSVHSASEGLNVLSDITNSTIGPFNSPERGNISMESDVSLPSSIKRHLPSKIDMDARGYTHLIDVSILDYTVMDPPVRSSAGGFDANAALRYDLDMSVNDADPLNQAIHPMNDSIADDVKLDISTDQNELPSFLNDSARCPPIEHCTEQLDSWNDIQVDHSIMLSMTSIRESSICPQDESSIMYSEESIANMMLNNQANTTAERIELSVDDLEGISFNRTRNDLN